VDQLLPATTVCRASTGVCDAAENCTGTSGSCPTDQFATAGTVCRAGRRWAQATIILQQNGFKDAAN